MRSRTFYVYIMAGKFRALYTGVTNNLERRVMEHKCKLVPGFTSKYNITRLVHYEVFKTFVLRSRVRNRSKDGCARRK